MKNIKDNVIWLLPSIFILVILLMIGTCTPRINDKFLVEKVRRENLEIFEKMRGKAEAKDLIAIGIDIQMGIDEIYFKEGEKVRKGDVIIKFSDYKQTDVDNQMKDKKRILAAKKSQLRFLEEQYKHGMNVKNQLQQIKGEIKAIEDELGMIEKNDALIQRNIVSPIDGYIVKINVIKGGTGDKNIPLVLLTKNNDIKIVSDPLRLSGNEYINIGNQAEIESIAEKERKAPATLYKINDTGVKELKTLEFLMNTATDFKLNEIFDIYLYYQKRENVLTVPVSSVVQKKKGNENKFFIYLINDEDRVTEKEIYLGVSNGKKIEIYGKDLKEGMEIIKNPNNRLQNNIIVRRRSLQEEKREKEEKMKKLKSENERKEKEIEKNKREIIILEKGEER
ncbi:efflux RND transporter periplasmic adaptor subunit [Leptotrichia sp. oral taxon 212]|jgi:efflux transporter, RND family, MFP subunit|uniref:efflux RND transporter periplasmic adaptor subunit n=1 Tax=Leptotrichia sp. oral taxon 212 TaxID=712357 RepID=UPI0006BCE16F|nr:RND transporter [Leptotrichia sp. oral taxon 212]ALA95389.1 RND transporter [Leptotrichia sp. oral taxon 212]